jgi:three-Cys-motif partner protein
MADTIWDIDPHTGVKHSILRRYLQAFFPKLAWAKRIVFIDGFAGPGRYSGGEPGSPIIALDAVVQHRHDMSDCEFVFVFIEADEERLQSLSEILSAREDPENVKVALRHGEFADEIEFVLDSLGGANLAPTFVMVDPFGVKGLPLATLARIASHPRTELLVSFMYESMARFLVTEEFARHLDLLFGTAPWRNAIELQGAEKKVFLRDLYSSQLRAIGMEYVRSFELRDSGNRTEYFLTFGTHNRHGLRAMKDAMWKVDGAGGYEFSDFTQSPAQPTLFAAEPDYDQLRQLIVRRFAGQTVETSAIDDFVLIDTPFREPHGKAILRELQREGAIAVDRPIGRNRSYWGPGTRITFA